MRWLLTRSERRFHTISDGSSDGPFLDAPTGRQGRRGCFRRQGQSFVASCDGCLQEASAVSIRSLMGRAMGRFSMLRRGDKVAVGVSGGKDSLSLLHAMVAYKKRAPFPYDL